DIGVVISFLGPRRELAGAVEQARDTGHAEGAEQGELQRPRHVERELMARTEEDDALVVALGVEPLNLGEDRGARHGPTPSLRARTSIVAAPRPTLARPRDPSPSSRSAG